MLLVTGKHVPDIDVEGLNPGDFSFFTGYTSKKILGLLFVCPCGCDHRSSLNFDPRGTPVWRWNGDQEKPTLSPSVFRTDECRWHGFLVDGVWKSA